MTKLFLKHIKNKTIIFIFKNVLEEQNNKVYQNNVNFN